MKHAQFKVENDHNGINFKPGMIIPNTQEPKPYKKPFKHAFFLWYMVWWIASITALIGAITYSIHPDIFFPTWAVLTSCCLLGFLLTKLLIKHL